MQNKLTFVNDHRLKPMACYWEYVWALGKKPIGTPKANDMWMRFTPRP